jgi:hypothetical protein
MSLNADADQCRYICTAYIAKALLLCNRYLQVAPERKRAACSSIHVSSLFACAVFCGMLATTCSDSAALAMRVCLCLCMSLPCMLLRVLLYAAVVPRTCTTDRKAAAGTLRLRGELQ